MRRGWLVLGLVLLAAGVLALLLGGLLLHTYFHAMDGDAALFMRLQRRAALCLALGGGLTVAGVLCLAVGLRR